MSSLLNLLKLRLKHKREKKLQALQPLLPALIIRHHLLKQVRLLLPVEVPMRKQGQDLIPHLQLQLLALRPLLGIYFYSYAILTKYIHRKKDALQFSDVLHMTKVKATNRNNRSVSRCVLQRCMYSSLLLELQDQL